MTNFKGLFEYDRTLPAGVRVVSERPVEDAVVRNFTHLDPFGVRRAAYLVRPAGETPALRPAVLYVHWYEPEAVDSNRTQFLAEAVRLAGRGAVSLLVETMWSDRDWFLKRTQAEDIPNSIRQVVSLRQALDLLLAEPGVDSERLVYVGHDFGGMYGVLLGAVDPRPKGYVIMAAAPRFPDWYLYYPKLEGLEREEYIRSFEPFDPITHVASLSPAPVLFQFADDDFHVSVERAQAFFEAASHPKEICWYQAGHGLNDQAAEERVAWIANQLKLTQP